ncbi:MAG: DUF4840 domain-containing protein [Prevotella sp.]|nr:DUF4840 domain-containing protein [Prevotella sp.]
MIKTRRILAVTLCLAAVTLIMTSCFGDDTTDTITEEQMRTSIASMAGPYDGSLFTGVIQNNMLTQTDSLGSQKWAADNNKITFAEFPASQLAKGVTDADIKKALEASEEMIKLEAYYYSFSSISAPYQFTLAPQTATVSVEYNGGTHELKFPFYQGGYSYGVGNMTTQTLQLVAAGMYVDGTHSSYFTEMAIIYTGKKI